MAQYTNASKVVAISNGQLTTSEVTSEWIDFVSAEVDTMLNTDFSLKDEIYYVQLRESTSKLLLKTPLYSTDVSNSTYTNFINSESLTYIYEDSTNKQLSPVIYIKEHSSEFPPLSTTDPLIEGKDYYPWQQNLFLGDPFKISNGMVKIEDTPGWGIEINPEWLDKSEYKKTEI